MSSKKDVSAIVSGAGLLTSIFSALVEEVKKRGGNDESIHRLSRPEGRELISKMAELIVGNPIIDGYPIEVGSTTIKDLVKQGRYDWSNSDVKDDHFNVDVPHQAEIILRHFNKNMSTDAVLKALDEEGLRPATMSELLALGIKYPDLQKQFPIIALGSVWQDRDGDRYVGSLGFRDGQRKLFLYWFGNDWLVICRFAAVRK